MSRLENNEAIHVTINGVYQGIWESAEGGEQTREGVVYYPGGMAPSIALSGPVEIGEVTIGHAYDTAKRKLAALLLKSRNDTITVTRQALDENANPTGVSITYTGRITEVTPPDYASDGNDVAMLEITMQPNGTVA